jgi:hypothetical protein
LLDLKKCRPTRNRFRTASWRERKRCACLTDLNRRICRSRWRVGMRGFDAIVGVPLHPVSHVAEDASRGSGVASQFVGNDLQWFRTLATQEFSKKSLCGELITMRLDQNVDHAAVLIHGAPQILLLAVDSNEDFTQMPVVAQPSLSSLQSPSIVETELLTPRTDRFIGYDDAALGEKLFDIRKLTQKR